MLAAGAAIGVFAFSGQNAASFKRYQLANFLLPSLRDPGVNFDTRDYSGKGLVVNFFFSTCPPCRQELPILQAASKNLPANVAMLGVDHMENRADGLAFVAKSGLTYDVALDEQGFVAPNVGAITFPATLFVNSSGVVVKRHFGAISADELQRGIDLVSHVS
jgi:cytochrome c biogenesis protein CcmG, thiol:disulfide interchange protein DsbE